jgi:SAM-dependent methyltransferase
MKNPEFNNEARRDEESWVTKEKNSKEFRDNLREQFLLPERDWNDKFKEYVEQLIQEKIEIESRETDQAWEEKSGERTFSRYLKGLDFKEEDLKGKSILDLGCGEDGEFIQECLKRGIGEKFLGVDSRIDDNIENKEHFIKGDYNNLPFTENDKFDYIFSVGAVGSCGEEESFKETLKEAIKFIKDDGELKFYPLLKASPETEENLAGIFESEEKMQEILKTLPREMGLTYEIVPIDIKLTGPNSKPDVLLDQLLTIKKLKKSETN